MRNSVLLAALLALSGSTLAAQEAAVLKGNKLREAVSGKTVYLMTPIGAEIPNSLHAQRNDPRCDFGKPRHPRR